MKKRIGFTAALVATVLVVGACGSGSYDADDNISNDITGTVD